MDVAIIGLPQSGKTTLFDALTRGKATSMGAAGPAGPTRVGVAKVLDPRLAVLTDMYHPRKVVPAEVRYWDLAGPEPSSRNSGIAGRIRNALQGIDTLLLVVRGFTNPAVLHPLGRVDPRRDLDAVFDELIFADLESLERGVERQNERVLKVRPAERPALVPHLEAVQKAKEGVESGVPVRRQELAASESGYLVDYQLLSAKPVVVVFNSDESGPKLSLSQIYLGEERAAGLGEVSICAQLEADLAKMSDDEASEFRREMGLGESALSQIVGTTYETLGLISFLTVGEDEVRAWSIPAGTPAQRAAAAVHSDFQKGFVRAEVIHYDDLVRCGSLAQGRKEGVLRSEGKSYPVKDGDVINFLVNP